jgi:hypothetical protein
MLHHVNADWQGERLVKDSCGNTIEFLHGASRGLVGGRAYLRRAQLRGTTACYPTPSGSRPVRRALSARRGRGRAGDWMLVTPSSSGWRKTSRTWRRHSGHASKKRTPWWASATSPGIGTWPPLIRPTSEMLWWGARHGRVGDQCRAVAGEAGDAVNTRGLDGLREGHRRQDGRESAGQHRRARPRRTKEEEI